jgi:hypothetical protein
VIVITLFELVLNDVGVTVTALSYEINAERACGLLSLSRYQLQIKGLIKDVDIDL